VGEAPAAPGGKEFPRFRVREGILAPHRMVGSAHPTSLPLPMVPSKDDTGTPRRCRGVSMAPGRWGLPMARGVRHWWARHQWHRAGKNSHVSGCEKGFSRHTEWWAVPTLRLSRCPWHPAAARSGHRRRESGDTPITVRTGSRASCAHVGRATVLQQRYRRGIVKVTRRQGILLVSRWGGERSSARSPKLEFRGSLSFTSWRCGDRDLEPPSAVSSASGDLAAARRAANHDEASRGPRGVSVRAASSVRAGEGGGRAAEEVMGETLAAGRKMVRIVGCRLRVVVDVGGSERGVSAAGGCPTVTE
jgi:hypothetical protein